MNSIFDTVAAIATPAGSGGIGIIRISGENAFDIADKIFFAKSKEKLSSLAGYTARLGDVKNAKGEIIDEVVALVFHAPRSYTGEDVVEIMCHGGEIVCETTLREVCSAGAVTASAGEFTRRALLNGRITLTEAEAVCDVINAASKQGEMAAAKLSHGALYKKTEQLKDEILEIQAHITAYIDFPEEDVDEIDGELLKKQLKDITDELQRLVSGYETGVNVIRGVPTVIVGTPNVGKSTLLNLLAGTEKALVTAIAGTTRDVVEQQVRLGGTTLLLADTAGIRNSEDVVERLGIEKALSRLENAALVLAVFDSSRALDKDDEALIARLREKNVVAVINKTDLQMKLDNKAIERAFANIAYISAKDDSSLAALDRAVARAVKTDAFDVNEPLLANERQRDCAVRALAAAQSAAEASESSTLDVVFALLSETLSDLAELSGENVSEAVLDEVFSRFCVGK